MFGKKEIIIIMLSAFICIISIGVIVSAGGSALEFSSVVSSSDISFVSKYPDLNSISSVASAPNDIAGKVVKAFLSPYTAKNVYRNIYLSNKTDVEFDFGAIYNQPPNIMIEKTEAPEVLILHTHATEGYLPKDQEYYSQGDVEQTTDESRSVIRVGEIICSSLKEYGITAVHDKTLHDEPSYTNSYNRSAETTLKYLEKYPSIKIVIDIHRDSVSTNGGLVGGVSEQNGKNAAQIMFVTGSQTGKVSGFENWQENLKLVLRLQELSETLYPGLARAIYFTSKKYNQHLSTGSLLIEVGTSANTIDEAEYSAYLLGKILGVGLNLFT